MEKTTAVLAVAAVVAAAVSVSTVLFSSSAASSQAMLYEGRRADVISAPVRYLSASDSPVVSARSCALINADTMELLYSRMPDYKTGMASTTKIMTGLIAAEYIEKNGYESYTLVPEEAAGIEGSSLYLKSGEKVRLIDLLYAMMLASANDAAAAIALSISPSIEDFAAVMNKRAEDMGLENTSFENPHGLDGDNHYTTASDLAALTAIALDNELLSKVVSTQNYTFEKEGTTVSVSNHNRLLSSCDGVNGVKTGYTKACGRCLVSSAERDGVRLIAVTLNAPNDWEDHRRMLDYGFSLMKVRTLAAEGEYSFDIPVAGGTVGSVKCENTLGLNACVFSAVEEDDIEVVVYLEKFLYAPVKKGQTVGKVRFTLDGKVLGEADIVALSDVGAQEYEKSLWEKIKDLFSYR